MYPLLKFPLDVIIIPNNHFAILDCTRQFCIHECGIELFKIAIVADQITVKCIAISQIKQTNYLQWQNVFSVNTGSWSVVGKI